MRISKLKRISAAFFGLFLFVLALKGSHIVDLGKGIVITIELPNIILIAKEYIYYIIFIAFFIFVSFSMCCGGKNKYPLGLLLYELVISYYFVISFVFGSGQIENLAAIAIVVLVTPAILNVINSLDNRGKFPLWLYSLNVFSVGFVFLNLIIYLLGYGYPEHSKARFFGATYHPNALGSMAALCAGILIAQFPYLNLIGKKNLIYLFTMAGAIFLTLISGSRSGMLMALVAVLALSRSRKSFLYFCVMVALVGLATLLYSTSDSPLLLAYDRMVTASYGNRDEVWRLLLYDFQKNFLLGVGDRTGVSGSAYLTAFAGTGLIGGALFIFIVLRTAMRALLLIKGYALNRTWTYAIVASVLMLQILVGALFEAAMFDRLSPIPLLVIIGMVVVNS